MGKESTYNAGDTGDSGLITGSGRSSEEGNDNSLQYSCLGNPTDRGAGWATAHGIAKSWTQLSNKAYTHVMKKQNQQKKDEQIELD